MFPTKELIGKTEAEATKMLSDAKVRVKVRAQRDRSSGEFLKDRVTIYVENGKVVRAAVG